MNITYQGNCHCGRYRFELTTPKIESATACTCGLCSKRGYLWLPVSIDSTDPGNTYSVVRDDGCLTDYQSKVLKDKFCNYCGTGVLGEHLEGPLKGQTLVNVRAIQGINPFEIEPAVKTIALKDDDHHSPAPFPASSDPPAQQVHHTGSCHCGKVSFELLAPISELEVKEDNCSLCVRDAYIGIYPTQSQVRLHAAAPEHDVFEYRHGPRFLGWTHCATCGVLVYCAVYGPPDIETVLARAPAERREHILAVHARNMALRPVNARVLDGGMDLAALGVVVVRSDEGTEGYVLD